MFADARMPIWGVSAILPNFLLVVLSRSGQRWFYFASLLMLILFVVIYARVSKPINRLQTEAARTGESLNNGRELQASWDRSVMIRVPALLIESAVYTQGSAPSFAPKRAPKGIGSAPTRLPKHGRAAQVRRRSCGANFATPMRLADSFTMCQTAFTVMPSPMSFQLC